MTAPALATDKRMIDMEYSHILPETTITQSKFWTTLEALPRLIKSESSAQLISLDTSSDCENIDV